MSLHDLLREGRKMILSDPDIYGRPIELVGPDGIEYKTSASSPDPLNPLPLYGQVNYSSKRFSPQTGEEIVIDKISVVIERADLFRIPEKGENWLVRIPEDPYSDIMISMAFTIDRASEGGQGLGLIRIYPHKAVQSA